MPFSELFSLNQWEILFEHCQSPKSRILKARPAAHCYGLSLKSLYTRTHLPWAQLRGLTPTSVKEAHLHTLKHGPKGQASNSTLIFFWGGGGINAFLLDFNGFIHKKKNLNFVKVTN